MKLIFLLVSFLALILISEAEINYDNFDLDSVLNNPRVLKNYLNCILDKGPCTKEGKDLKRDFPNAIQNSCANCSQKTKDMVRKAVKHIKKSNPVEWEMVLKKYDPDGKYQSAFDTFLNQ